MSIIARVGLAKARLMRIVPYIGYLSLYLKPVVSTTTSTASVSYDGVLSLNEEFIGKLTDPELTAILAHETLHVALRFWQRLGKRDHRLFNMAHDYIINLIIFDHQSAEMVLPVPNLLDHGFRGKSAEEVYELLKKRRKIELTTDLDGDCLAADTSLSGESLRQESEKWKLRIKDALDYHGERGSIPAGILREIEEISPPQISWLEQIAQFLTDFGPRKHFTYLRPSRRSESLGEVLGSYKPSGQEVCVLVDTSGSIKNERLAQALGEIDAMCQSKSINLRVMVVDAAVHADITIESVIELKKSLRGGGGSNFIPAFDILEKETFKGVVIAFTDGAIAVPQDKPHCVKEVLWVLNSRDNPPAVWGQVIRIPK